MAGFPPKDQRSQILLMLTVAAGVVGWSLWQDMPLPPLKVVGWATLRDSITATQVQLDTIEARLARVRQDVRRGAGDELDTRLAQYRSSLGLMRQLVPTSSEVADLLDDVSSRAKMRGTTLAEFNMQPTESGAPFDTKRGRIRVTGTFDQVGELLTDIASLPRIVVPYDVTLQHVTGAVSDTARSRGLLEASFGIRTYVRPVPAAGAPTAAAAPAAPAAPSAAPSPRAQPQGGGGRE